MKALIIAAPASGSGKTTVTIGLMECLMRRGLKVAPFKVGPDFIDPGYHRLVTGRPSLNLDPWMCSPDQVRETFARAAADADIAVIEGVMGLFDGISARSDEGSTAQVARLTGAPVVLVVDAKGLARSAAAMVKGFAEFDRAVRVVGVIFNNVASDNHGRLLTEAMEATLPEVRVLGCIPRDERLAITSRHLGLCTAEENPLTAGFLDHLAAVIERNIAVEGLLEAAASPHPQPLSQRERVADAPSVRIGVARDAAFCFVYEENLRLLREAGAELAEFSPISDQALPEGIAGLYLPGGYPELFADTLAANRPMLEAIRQAVEAGMPAYAECGGFIYLTGGLAVEDELRHRFVNIFPVATRMLPRRKALGYREVELNADSVVGPAGTVARGHEFHYSETEAMPPVVERLYRVRKGESDLGTEGFRHRNCLASYIHLHFGSNPAMAAAFVSSCREFRTRSPR